MTTTDGLALFVFTAVIAVRILLWRKFRDDRRGKRIAVSTAQLIVVVLAIAAYDSFGSKHTVAIAVLALAAIIGLSFIPIKTGSTTR